MANVSVIMGIYNCADTLPKAIDSLLAQTFTDWNLVMCDDGSRDATYEVAERYRRTYPERITLLKNEQNMGLNYTLNRCLSIADGAYIARQDGDDVSMPTRFEKEAAILDAFPDIAIVSTAMTYFDEIVSGPIVQYAEMEPQLRDHPVTREGFGTGARLFLIGLAKKVLLANTLGTTFYALSALPMTQLSTLSAWLGAVCYALMLYFDFSGYSDMAIGLASMFGFRFGKNFDYPYVSQSITEFWRRWHISLGAWFRDYVYIPCGGSRAGTARTIANLLLVWLLTGIWHGANWTFLLWGVYYGILLLLEKFVLRRVLEHLPGLLRHVLTLLLVLIGWVFFFSSSPAAAFGWIGRMFGSGSALVDATAKYYLAGCWPLLLVGAIGSFPVVSHVGTNLLRRSKAWQAFSVVLFLALLLLCIALMMNDTYSTFLYFQF